MNLVRIWVIAANGFRETIRDRILYFIGFFALLLLLALQLLPQVAVGTDEKIFLDFGLGAIGLLSAMVAIFVGTGLISKEIEKRTVLVLISKPVSRGEFILGKHLGLCSVEAVLVGAMALIYLGLLRWSQIAFQLGSLLVSLLYLLIELALLTAVAMVFSVFTSSILATLLSIGIYFMGHFSRDLLKLGKITENENIEALTQTLYLILPDLERLNLRNQAVYGLLPNTSELLLDALYGLVYMVLLLTVAILVFSQREF
ncbi:MAG: ABC transporter permease [Gomphosphaeria aponina SAG 52.96 = DSM 107014]|uniref:ABC transporter permease n=1 Tax=Gomphosphaeria aponina SAG 52.96 = DSM 107014 TaxID=1521640 RepID=A0A941GU11_9CHRO|nr:ABC transporter permease [Gomphosphaeria aponina SAG 52.96 = DSM 107014]